MTKAKHEHPDLPYDLSDDEAVEIASQWHSVMTWSDPGVVMYSVTSTGKVHSEEHRTKLLAYIDKCVFNAVECDRRGDDPVVMDSNEEDLYALRAWVENYQIESEDE